MKLMTMPSFWVKVAILCMTIFTLTLVFRSKEVGITYLKYGQWTRTRDNVIVKKTERELLHKDNLSKDRQNTDAPNSDIVKGDGRELLYKDDFVKLMAVFKKEIKEEILNNMPNTTKCNTNYYRVQEPLPSLNPSDCISGKMKQDQKEDPTTFIEPSKLLGEPILNPFEISYHINDPKSHCIQNKTLLLIVVPSAPGNFQRREKVRKYDQATYVKDLQNRAKLLFFLGSLDPTEKESKAIQDRIDKEQALHGDIVQATFLDNYKNITMKAASLLHWGSTYCREAKYLLRTDDDVKVSTSKIVASIKRQSLTNEQFILGKTRKNEYPYPDPKGKYKKYFVPNSQWSHKKPFPTFLLGGAYALPMKTAGLMLETMRRTKFVWLDDVFVTGICAKRVGVPIFHDEAFLFGHDNNII